SNDRPPRPVGMLPVARDGLQSGCMEPVGAGHPSRPDACWPAGMLVGTARFELATPSPPDWCANQAAPRLERGPEGPNGRQDITAPAASHLPGPPPTDPPTSGAAGAVPGPDPDHQADRRALEPEGAPQVLLQVAPVAGGERAAGEQDHLGGLAPGRGGVGALPRGAPPGRGWRALGPPPQPLVEGGGGDAPRPLGEHPV